MNKLGTFALVVSTAGLALFAYNKMSTQMAKHHSSSGGTALVEINLPAALSANASAGKSKFEANCASCHGLNAVGKDGLAPPLVHKIYEPSHHGDESFQRAAASGVKSHHWRFGNMPPVEGISRDEVAMIVSYIRELQRENGIY